MYVLAHIWAVATTKYTVVMSSVLFLGILGFYRHEKDFPFHNCKQTALSCLFYSDYLLLLCFEWFFLFVFFWLDWLVFGENWNICVSDKVYWWNIKREQDLISIHFFTLLFGHELFIVNLLSICCYVCWFFSCFVVFPLTFIIIFFMLISSNQIWM